VTGTRKLRMLPLLAIVAVVAACASCTSEQSTDSTLASVSGQPATTTTVPLPPIVIPPRSTACPPGCRYNSRHDAVSALASWSNLVAIVTVRKVLNDKHYVPGAISVDHVLQGNPHHLVYRPTRLDLERTLVGTASINKSYVVFTSFSRAGACLSALFSYDPNSKMAKLIESSSGSAPGVITLSGRKLRLPQVSTLSNLEAHMYPTGPVVYSTGSAVWYCPGV
jgi:hypothetical protein